MLCAHPFPAPAHLEPEWHIYLLCAHFFFIFQRVHPVNAAVNNNCVVPQVFDFLATMFHVRA